jgi:hypothetical protein
MFAVVATGRLVQTNFQQVEPTKYILPLENASAISHLVIKTSFFIGDC